MPDSTQNQSVTVSPEVVVAQEFLNWNRAQELPPVTITKELGVAKKALQVALKQLEAGCLTVDFNEFFEWNLRHTTPPVAIAKVHCVAQKVTELYQAQRAHGKDDSDLCRNEFIENTPGAADRRIAELETVLHCVQEQFSLFHARLPAGVYARLTQWVKDVLVGAGPARISIRGIEYDAPNIERVLTEMREENANVNDQHELGAKRLEAVEAQLAQAQGALKESERFARLGRHITTMAEKHGWKREEGEGAFEFIQRHSYAVGIEDAGGRAPGTQTYGSRWPIDELEPLAVASADLPQLPVPCKTENTGYEADPIRYYSETKVVAFARAAIENYARKDVPVAWLSGNRSILWNKDRDKMLEDPNSAWLVSNIWANAQPLFAGRVPATYQRPEVPRAMPLIDD